MAFKISGFTSTKAPGTYTATNGVINTCWSKFDAYRIMYSYCYGVGKVVVPLSCLDWIYQTYGIQDVYVCYQPYNVTNWKLECCSAFAGYLFNGCYCSTSTNIGCALTFCVGDPNKLLCTAGCTAGYIIPKARVYLSEDKKCITYTVLANNKVNTICNNSSLSCFLISSTLTTAATGPYSNVATYYGTGVCPECISVIGYNNTLSSYSNLVIGCENALCYSYDIVIGNKNHDFCTCNVTLGNNNYLIASESVVVGNSNNNCNCCSVIIGNDNELYSSTSKIMGTTYPSDNIVIGNSNSIKLSGAGVSTSNNIIIGNNNYLCDNCYSIIIGSNNCSLDSCSIIIGNNICSCFKSFCSHAYSCINSIIFGNNRCCDSFKLFGTCFDICFLGMCLLCFGPFIKNILYGGSDDCKNTCLCFNCLSMPNPRMYIEYCAIRCLYINAANTSACIYLNNCSACEVFTSTEVINYFRVIGNY